MSIKKSIIIFGLGLLTCYQAIQAAPLYSINTIGIYDSAFTSNSATQLNEAGQVAGNAQRFNGASVYLGRSAWFYNGSSTANVGFTSAEYTRDDGYKDSFASWLNEAGQVAGTSQRYSGGSANLGSSAWLYNGSDTVNVGLTGAEYTSNDGNKGSTVSRLNEAGQVMGGSFRYGGSTWLGHSVWLYNGTNTKNVGLTGAEYTRNNGFKSSSANWLNQAGQVAGSAKRYNGGNADLGSSAWLYNGSNTENVGLTGTEYTRNDEYKSSSVNWLNEAGQVAGNAQRFNGGFVDLGKSAWFYNGSNTVNVGPTGAEYTRKDGYKNSTVNSLNQAGQVLGSANRYNGGNKDLGRSVWLYNGSSTVNVGLTGVEHTRNDGYKKSTVSLSSGPSFNEAGQVAGVADRYNGGSVYLGRSAWFYNGSSTIDIGLSGAEYTNSNGYKFNFIAQLNEAGQVAGGANRYDGGSADLGRSAWFYDDATGMTYSMDFSIRASDGYASSSASYLGDDGLMLGSYQLYDETDSSLLGSRVFGFTVDDGFYDLGLQIEGGLDLLNWDYLANAVTANGSGQILGYGPLSDMSGRPAIFLATPSVVPVPAAVWLFGSGLLGLIGVARRKKA